MNAWGPLGVAWFEWKRSLSIGRISLWFGLALFPVLLAFLARARAGGEAPDQAVVLLLFFLVVRVSSVMGLLLWATPVINDEIEGRTWIYIATRPTGSRSIVLGKYLVATLWSMSAGLVAAAAAIAVSGVDQPFRVWWVISLLTILGCFAYGSLLTLIGTLVQRRAMVVAIIYIVFVEGVMSMLPATINRFTVGYRLVSLVVHWMGYAESEISPNVRMLFGEASAATHIAILVGYSVLLLGLAIVRVRAGGYLTEPED